MQQKQDQKVVFKTPNFTSPCIQNSYIWTLYSKDPLCFHLSLHRHVPNNLHLLLVETKAIFSTKLACFK